MFPKYKAWDKKNKIMYEADKINILICPEEFICVQDFDGNALIDPEHVVLLLSTGKFDDNKNEIFDGHILETDLGIRVVSWNEESVGFKPFVEQIFSAVDTYSEWEFKNFKIIGNIYENPELRK